MDCVCLEMSMTKLHLSSCYLDVRDANGKNTAVEKSESDSDLVSVDINNRPTVNKVENPHSYDTNRTHLLVKLLDFWRIC